MHQKTVYVALTLMAVLTLGAHAKSPITRPEQLQRAGLVVDFGEGNFITRCVTFSEPEISGYEALTRSGLDIAASGGAVCSIAETGCPADDCFCAIPDYWSYWHFLEGTWQYSGSGAQGYTVGDGDIEGWSWEGEPPPTLSFDQICAPYRAYLPLLLMAGG
jgi:hypothetical protein